MNSSVVSQQFKLAAIDLDGTLLGPDREISSENFCAVQQLQQSGLHVVLASGRHYLNIHRYAAALPGIEWIVSVQGGESADLTRANVLNRDFLPAAMPRQILELGDALGFTSLITTSMAFSPPPIGILICSSTQTSPVANRCMLPRKASWTNPFSK